MPKLIATTKAPIALDNILALPSILLLQRPPLVANSDTTVYMPLDLFQITLYT